MNRVGGLPLGPAPAHQGPHSFRSCRQVRLDRELSTSAEHLVRDVDAAVVHEGCLRRVDRLRQIKIDDLVGM